MTDIHKIDFPFVMNQRISAGLLMYRIADGHLQVFIAHPGGPYFTNKDTGVWSIPKGEIEKGEDLLNTAIREFVEETGIQPAGDFFSLGYVKQRTWKVVYAWAFEYEGVDLPQIKSNECEIEWPPRSGKKISIPEIDRADFFPAGTAKEKVHHAQAAFIGRLEEHLAAQKTR